MPIGDWNPIPKPKHKRNKKTARQRGSIPKAAYAKAWERSGGRCERCGKDEYQAWTLEAAHVERRWKTSQDGIGPADIVILCGPSTDSSTCHHWADYTRAGRQWLLYKREEIRAKEDEHGKQGTEGSKPGRRTRG